MDGSSGMSERRWYAVITQPQRESKAREHLCDRDFEVFLPELVEQFGHPKRDARERVSPLFPRYVFVHAAPDGTPWHLIKEAPCVAGIVTERDRPLAARRGAVERLAELAAEGDGTLWFDGDGDLHPGPFLPNRRGKKRLPFAPGQPLRITGGVFSGYLGLYLGGHGPRLKLWVDIFGRPVQHTVPEALVRPA